jgi:lipoate synthase
MIDFKEVIESWITKFNPTDLEKQLSEERLTICKNCVYYTEVLKKKKWSAVCTECSCPLIGKIFTSKVKSCRIGNWYDVDKKYGIYKETKTNKTIL